MPTLNWIGKEAVVEHHKHVPFRLLKCNEKLSVGEDAGNLLIQGDNLEALKALLPYYAGQVKCIYIDPPYNTGNEGWVYNDNVNSPEIKDWLNKVVGSESEDLSRHDKWLCMMYPRLVLLRQMLRNDGTIFISIDDNEQPSLRLLMNEIFGASNFLACVTWQKKYGPANDAKYFSQTHEYIVGYAKNISDFKINLLPREDQQLKAFKNPDNDPRGLWRASDLSARTYSPSTDYPIEGSDGKVFYPPKSRSWIISKKRYLELLEDNRITFGASGNGRPMQKKFLSEVREGITSQTWWDREFAGDNKIARYEMKDLFPENPFDTPKPIKLIQRILQISTNKGDLILDSFAGSGTTGHAVLKQNVEDGGQRKFILVEMDEKIAKSITSERLKRAINGYGKAEGLDGGFRFCELGATLFDGDGQIRAEVSYGDLAQHVYFVETGQPLPQNAKKHFPLLGVANEKAVYLLYNGILKDKSATGGNVLTHEVLHSLPKHAGAKVVYGNGCRLGANRLRALNITFKQIPYEIREA